MTTTTIYLGSIEPDYDNWPEDERGCAYCGADVELTDYHGDEICGDCREKEECKQ